MQIKGPIFSIITPFKRNGLIDYKSLKKYMIFLKQRGAKIFYVMFYNSRLGLLSSKEIKELNFFVIDFGKKNKIDVIAATPYHISLNENIFLSDLFFKRGAKLISVIFGEKYYSEYQVEEYFYKLFDKSKANFILHQQPMENGISDNPPTVKYSLKLLNKLAKSKKLIAMKEDAKNKNYTKLISSRLSKKLFIITSGRGKMQWIESTNLGSHAWLSGISCLDPKIGVRFYHEYKNKNYKYCHKVIQYFEKPFFKVKDKLGWHLTIKSCLEYQDLMKRFERPPLKELNDDKIIIVKKMMKKLLTSSNKYFPNENFFKY